MFMKKMENQVRADEIMNYYWTLKKLGKTRYDLVAP